MKLPVADKWLTGNWEPTNKLTLRLDRFCISILLINIPFKSNPPPTDNLYDATRLNPDGPTGYDDDDATGYVLGMSCTVIFVIVSYAPQ